jgi:superfamily II DNA/RNA helicase
MDSMLDMGMKKQLDQILQYMPQKRQVLMFSATVPNHILEISRKYLKNPKRVIVGSATKPAPEVEQTFLKMPHGNKYAELDRQLNAQEGTAIIFVTTKRGADKLTSRLQDSGHKADVVHGGLNQHKRSKVIAGFRAERIRILVATDVVARGLDVNHIKFVFNYDLPMAAEDYLHRIGRTGRARAQGFAISFVSPEDSAKMKAIERLIHKGESSPRETFKKKARAEPRSEGRSEFRKKAERPRSEGYRSDRPRSEGYRSDRPKKSEGYRSDRPRSEGYRSDRPKSEDEETKKKKGQGSKPKRRQFSNKPGSGSGYFPRKGKSSAKRNDAKKISGPKKNSGAAKRSPNFYNKYKE